MTTLSALSAPVSHETDVMKPRSYLGIDPLKDHWSGEVGAGGLHQNGAPCGPSVWREGEQVDVIF